MKKLVLLNLVGLLVLSMMGCEKKESKYSEEKRTLEYLIKITDKFTRELDVTGNRIAIGRAIEKYATEIKRIKPGLYQLEKICPEFKTTDGYRNAPKELQPLFKQVGESLAHMKMVAEGKTAKFSQDKDLVKRYQELKEVLFYY
ncbi:MAG: hypothetical protein PVH61_06580 [Candidatus Aminicenantes bacterium]|jgi:hypothetical protein